MAGARLLSFIKSRQRLFVPVKEFLNSLFYFDFMLPAKAVQLRDVDEFSHRSIRLGGIKLYGTLEAYGLDNELGEFMYGEFLACADIDMAVADLTE